MLEPKWLLNPIVWPVHSSKAHTIWTVKLSEPAGFHPQIEPLPGQSIGDEIEGQQISLGQGITEEGDPLPLDELVDLALMGAGESRKY